MKELLIQADMNNLEKIDTMIGKEPEGMDLNQGNQTTLHIMVKEIHNDIAFYAYPVPSGAAKVHPEFDASKREMKTQSLDQGIPYDPLKKANPDIMLLAEEREVGGLEIYMVKNNVDQVNYRYEDDWNVFTMKRCMGKGGNKRDVRDGEPGQKSRAEERKSHYRSGAEKVNSKHDQDTG